MQASLAGGIPPFAFAFAPPPGLPRRARGAYEGEVGRAYCAFQLRVWSAFGEHVVPFLETQAAPPPKKSRRRRRVRKRRAFASPWRRRRKKGGKGKGRR